LAFSLACTCYPKQRHIEHGTMLVASNMKKKAQSEEKRNFAATFL